MKTRHETLLEGTVHLKPGQEWHSPAINVACGDRLNVSGTSRGGRFCVKLLPEQDYVDSFNPNGPTRFFPLSRYYGFQITKWVWLTRVHRAIFRVPSSQPDADIHITVSIRRKEGSAPPAGPAVTVDVGTTTPQMRAREGVEAAIVWAVIALGLMALALVNAAVYVGQSRALLQGGPALVSLFQADAEWCIFLVALYVAAKTLPEWLAKRAGQR
jgi:hypothetical protein